MPNTPIWKEMRRFLSTAEPEILCISGRWGVGKTYNWRQALTQAERANSNHPDRLKLQRYAYVSLFGINSLDDLKYAIFENTRRLGSSEEPSINEYVSKLKEMTERVARKSLAFG